MDDVLERELRRLAVCVGDAREHAEAGHVRRGYSVLLRGFFRAEQAMINQAWVPSLISRWRAAIDSYCQEFDPQSDTHEEAPAGAGQEIRGSGPH